MYKKLALVALVLFSQNNMAASEVDLFRAPVKSLDQYLAKPKSGFSKHAVSPSSNNDALQQVNQTNETNQTIVRYQQMYKGIPVVGAQVTISTVNQGNTDDGKVNGHLLNGVQLNTNPKLSGQQAIDLAKKSYNSDQGVESIKEEQSELQIRPAKDKQLKLVYLVSFKTVRADKKPDWPFFIVDAETGEISKQWNNIKAYLDTGPGGNEKVSEYWYGKDGLPGLNVKKMGDKCLMNNYQVKLVHLDSKWDWDNSLLTPLEYPCGQNQDTPINGAFSPTNDAYFFGHVIVNMYKNWYGLNALQFPNGNPMQLVMRVHFGENFDNAFWDGEVMSFGDGKDFYPLVSLDIAGHEVTHGFTQQHAGLEYHDESGSLNESMSDMAGQASRAYLLDTMPAMYSKAYMQATEVSWGIGETIVPDAFGKALRFMDYPSSDGSSADCVDKALALSSGAFCAISYPELVAFAEAQFANPIQQQSYIVHTGSGVFNKAFFLLSKKIGIKEAYRVMLTANTKYWTPNTGFEQGACGVIHAAQDLSVNLNDVKTIFNQVGIQTKSCSIS